MVAPMHEQRQEVGRAQVVCSSDVCDGGSVIMKLTEHWVWSRSTFFFSRSSTLTQRILRNTRSSQTYNRSIRCSSVWGTSLKCNFPPETGRVRSYKWFCPTVLFSTVHTFNFYRPVFTLVLVLTDLRKNVFVVVVFRKKKIFLMTSPATQKTLRGNMKNY